MSDLSTDIGKRLRDYRKKLNMTQQDVADLLGISLNYYGSIERGKSKLSVDKLLILNRKLNADLTYLIAGHSYVPDPLLSIFMDCPKEKQADMEQLLMLLHKLSC